MRDAGNCLSYNGMVNANKKFWCEFRNAASLLSSNNKHRKRGQKKEKKLNVNIYRLKFISCYFTLTLFLPFTHSPRQQQQQQRNKEKKKNLFL